MVGDIRTWHWTYTDGTTPPSGLLESLDGPRTDVSDLTTFGYYPNGDLHTVTNAEGHVTTVESYDPHGRPTWVVDPIGMATEYDYDLRGRVIQQRVAAGTNEQAVLPEYQVSGVSSVSVSSPETSASSTADTSNRRNKISSRRQKTRRSGFF